MTKKKVLIKGPLLTQSGYGVHSRQVFKWLLDREDFEVKCIVTPWGRCSWILDQQNDLIKSIMDCAIGEPTDKFDISFQVQLPNEWNPFLAEVNIGVTAAVETNVCNPSWVECCERMDKVIVPSSFTKKVLVDTGLSESKVEVIHESFPLAFEEENFEKDPVVSKIIDNLETKNNFLIFGQITGNNQQSDRKNLFTTIQGFIEAFKNNKDTGLIIKTNVGSNSKTDKYKTINVIRSILNELGKSAYPKIHVLHGSFTENQLRTLYCHEKVKYLLTSTRGEGFGLPILEASSLSLPVIATNWSGHLDFLKLGNFTRLNYTLKEIHESRIDNNIFMSGSKWAEVTTGHLRLTLKKSFDNYGKVKKNAKVMSSKIKEEFCFSKIKQDYDNLLESI